MTEFKDLQAIAGELYSTDEMKTWLFTHTRSQEEYEQVRRALKVLSCFQPVEWMGKPGNRHPVEVI